jgi:hypothetical protein
MIKHIPHCVMMVKPTHFGFNEETAQNNAFQNKIDKLSPQIIQDIALLEFESMVNQLITNGIEVITYTDEGNTTPDSIFPNNWFSTFTNELLLYPMFSENRRLERKPEFYQDLSNRLDKGINDSLVGLEEVNEILEGTGSLVCDYESKTAFAALSERTTPKALDKFEETSGYSTVRFTSLGPDGKPIYHTNVMLTMAQSFAVVGLNTIIEEDRDRVKEHLEGLGKELLVLSNEQVYHHFAGNMLQLRNEEGDVFLVMSKAAYQSLSEEQIDFITEKHQNKIIACPIHIIETIGGGSARCMMAEVFYKL